MVDRTFPLLGQLLSALVATPSVDGSELALLATKVVWSATQLSLPPLLLQPAQLDAWMGLLLALLQQPLPPDAPTEPDDAAAWAPWKV